MARRGSLLQELEAMRQERRKLAHVVLAARALAKSIECNAGVVQALTAFRLADSPYANQPRRVYSVAFKHYCVKDALRVGPTRAAILNGVPYQTLRLWCFAAKGWTRKGKNVGRASGAPTKQYTATRKAIAYNPKRKRKRYPALRARKIDAMLSQLG